MDFVTSSQTLSSDCNNTAKFIGVVLDDTRQHLKGYVYELPMITSIESLLFRANSRSETIPWFTREFWGRQMIQTLSDIHKKGLIVGVVSLDSFGLRADGTAVLLRLETSQRHLRNEAGIMPPELRQFSKDGVKVLWNVSFRTDVFQLGYVLWLLAEHKPIGHGHLCAKSACVKPPHSMCNADHANPVELPNCCSGIPPFFNDIIRQCRSRDPQARPSAHKLAKVLPSTVFKDTSLDMDTLWNIFFDTAHGGGHHMVVYCDNCGTLTTAMH